MRARETLIFWVSAFVVLSISGAGLTAPSNIASMARHQPELEIWLRSRAQLDGNKLQRALEICQNEMIEGFPDLYTVYIEKKLKDVFPIAIFIAIEKGMEAGQGTDCKPASTATPNKKNDREPTSQSAMNTHSQLDDQTSDKGHIERSLTTIADGLGVAKDALPWARSMTQFGFSIAEASTKFGFGIGRQVLTGTAYSLEYVVGSNPGSMALRAVDSTAVAAAETLTMGGIAIGKGITLTSLDATHRALHMIGIQVTVTSCLSSPFSLHPLPLPFSLGLFVFIQ